MQQTKLQNEPNLARRGYVELGNRAAPRGRIANCVCQNEPIFKVDEASSFVVFPMPPVGIPHFCRFFKTNPIYRIFQRKRRNYKNEPNLPSVFLCDLCGKKQNKPILARRGYVELGNRVAPRGRIANCVCQNEPI